MRKKLLFVVMAICLSVTACGKSDSKKETVKNVGNEVVSSSGVEDESDTESDTKDEDDKESKKDEDTVYNEYYKNEVYYTLPMMHSYNNTSSHVNDNYDIFLMMSKIPGSTVDGIFNPDKKVELDKILEENKYTLCMEEFINLVNNCEYKIDYSEEYTTKTGIKGIKYEGSLGNDTVSYYFYSFVFNTDKSSFQYIGFSSDQKVGNSEDEFDLTEIKNKIKTTMDQSIDTIRIEN